MRKKKERKATQLPNVRVEEGQLKRWKKAHQVCKDRNPELSLAAWVRYALDQQANLDLSKH
jgi:hypothetical protein